MSELERIEVPVPDLPVATVRITPDEAREMQQRVNEIISGVLVQGKDYMQIPGTPKPSLLKPGAEALQRFFGFGSTSQTETGMLDEGEFYAKSTVQVINQSGMILSEATGWCDNTEQGRRGPKWKGDRNTIIQMAQKRAYVSAVKTATATSDHFTQDIDESARPQQAASDPPPASTPDQRLLLSELFSKLKPCSLVEAREWLSSQGEKAQSERWVCKQITSLLLRGDSPMGGGGTAEESGSVVQPATTPQEGDPELPPDPPEVEVEVEDGDDDIPF